MSIFLEITQLENGDIVLREAGNEADSIDEQLADRRPPAGEHAPDPLVRISFSDEVKDMLGGDLVGVAEAMIDAATDFLGEETIDNGFDTEIDNEVEAERMPPAPVIH